MASRPGSGKPKRPPRGDAAEYRFVIDAYTPQTIPMGRLAEYMRELAEVLGEHNAVHFKRLEAGSTVLVSKIEREAVPKVRARVVAVRRGEAPREALRAYKAINKLLREDNGVGALKDDKAGATIIRFPGRDEAEEKFPSVHEHGSVDGVIVRIGGADETVHITLQVDGQEQVSGCYTNRLLGKQLAHKLFEPVRLFGRGRWSRDNEGQWTLVSFKVESFDPLSDMPLSAALTDLRAIPNDWDEASLTQLALIRHGPPRKTNGGH
jgi:hypothetical protein